MVVNEAHQVVRYLEFLGTVKEFVFAHARNAGDFLVHQAHVSYGLDDIARTRLALGTDHRRAFFDTAQRFAQILRAAHERNVEFTLVDVENVIGRRKHFTFVNVVNLDSLQNLRFGKVTNTAFGHDRNRDGVLNAFDHLGVAHARHTACGTNVGGNAFECHHGGSTCGFGDFGLFGGRHIHNDATLEHLGKVLVEFVTILVRHVNLLGCGMV